MHKALKITAILVAVVIAALAVAAVVLSLVIDPNRYRDDIIQAVKQQTGRDFKIEGDLSLSLFPWIGLETDRLALSNAPGFGAEPFAVVTSSDIKIALLPLLRGQVAIDAVRLHGVTLNLARKANGRTNWDDLVAAQAGAEQKPKPETTKPGAGAALAAFTLNRFELRDSAFTWRDEAARTAYAARNVNLTSGNVLGGKPAPVKLAFDVESKNPPIRARVELDARARLDAATETLEVPELKLAFGALRVQAQLRGTDMLRAPKLAGRLEVPAFDARALLQKLGVGYAPADPNALRKLALRAALKSDPAAHTLSDLRLTLDDTQLTGSLALQQRPSAAYRFDIGVDNIDVDRYLPASPNAKEGKKPDTPAGKAEAAVIPLALLRETNAEGALRVGRLKAFGIRSQDVVAKVTAQNGRITLGPNSAKLYSGTYNGRTVVDASGRVPQFRFEEKLAGIQLGPLLKDAGVFDRYTGTGDVNLNLTAQGLDAGGIKRTLNGNAAVSLRDGKIEGVNLQKIVQQAQALLKQARGREVEGTTQSGDETAFKSLTATARVTNGVVRNDDLKLDGPVVRAQGSGTANLADETLDYRLQVTLAEAAGRQGTTVPVHVYGPFAALKYRVDIGGLLKEQAGEKIEKKLDERLERLRQKLRR